MATFAWLKQVFGCANYQYAVGAREIPPSYEFHSLSRRRRDRSVALETERPAGWARMEFARVRELCRRARLWKNPHPHGLPVAEITRSNHIPSTLFTASASMANAGVPN